MKTNNVICVDAIDALIDRLGPVDAERFIAIVKQDSFDYTEWHEQLWDGKTIEQIHAMAIGHEAKQNETLAE